MYCNWGLSMHCEDLYRFDSDSKGLANWSIENWGRGSMSVVEESLLLDGDEGEFVNASENVGRKIVSLEGKDVSALKSHSEAERRRRERINAHFSILRGLVPSSEKMDKATLLTQVITELKQLKKAARQASDDMHLPMDTDEIRVEKLDKRQHDGSFLMRASICCEYRPDLLSSVKEAINSLPLQMLDTEISTLNSRVKYVFLLTAHSSNAAEDLISSHIHAALSDILDKVSASAEFSQQLVYPQKRQRLS